MKIKKTLAIINSHNISNQISKILTRIVLKTLNLILDGCVHEERRSMNYLEFVRVVEKEINRNLKGGMRAKLYTAIKNNSQKRIGIIVENPAVNVSPTIYLEDYYIRYHQGIEIGEISREILMFYEKLKCEKSWNPEIFDNYGEIRKKIAFKIINTEKNKEFLNRVPHIDFLDLSLVFYVIFNVNNDGAATMIIHNDNMERWGICLQELVITAIENVNDLLPAQLITMQDVVEALENPVLKEGANILKKGMENDGETMYILSNAFRNLGAACMVYPGVLKMVGDIFEKDFYLLPSSIHEVILVPRREQMSIQQMNEMVEEVNTKYVAEEEILSNHAYYYSRKEDRLLMKEI